MSIVSDIGEFGNRLRTGFDQFRREEANLRGQYAASPDSDPMPDSMLERTTRGFLIDHFLKALDWNPEDPSQIIEEARAQTQDGDRLYFDYLGVDHQDRTPILILEAKGFDVPPPRRARSEPDADTMAALLSEAIFALKYTSQRATGIIAEWVQYLKDLHLYVISIGDIGHRTLRRVVISAGNWTIVFEEPVECFVTAGLPRAEKIHCYPSVQAILDGHEQLFSLLHRKRLVDTLPLALAITEALEFVPANKIDECYKGVLVATSTSSGAVRKRYPTRTVYPSLIISSGGRWFAIIDFDSFVEEPKGQDLINDFVTVLDNKGEELLSRLNARMGAGLAPKPLDQFPGFPDKNAQLNSQPVAGSTTDRAQTTTIKNYVVHSGASGAPSEYVVLTGDHWFYKNDVTNDYQECTFHYWNNARKSGVAEGGLHYGCSVNSFTEDSQNRHCAHGDLRRVRSNYCQLLPVETHMCCQGCIYLNVCWDNRASALPCLMSEDSV